MKIKVSSLNKFLLNPPSTQEFFFFYFNKITCTIKWKKQLRNKVDIKNHVIHSLYFSHV
ncbi:hypothetical protein BCE_2692 [Bacillus cereus ATCC 10987]|uniref:Uncharacterized protein n=1 Tax=Bacillus cereus (strain ATCC 10987 / NRS 248) TaxID=222523 RepID=Q737F7_BACC1|nr:hypothetical protein BCE_2692 [Bacillus cereus ATCC 10987]